MLGLGFNPFGVVQVSAGWFRAKAAKLFTSQGLIAFQCRQANERGVNGPPWEA